MKEREASDYERLHALPAKYETVFQGEMLPGLPSFWETQHIIKTGRAAKPSNKPLYEMSRAEQLAEEEFSGSKLQSEKLKEAGLQMRLHCFYSKNQIRWE